MQIAVIVILALLCAALALRLHAMERDLRGAVEQLRERERSGSTARVGLKAPHPAAEQLLLEVNRLLELRQAERSEFHRREEALRRQIANVSHDLRTPLTPILGYLQLLAGEELGEAERREYLAIVEGRARTLQTLIAAFYDLSRIEGGEYPLVREQVDLYGVLSELLAEFYEDFENSGFAVEVELAQGLPPVWGDRAAVVRVFSNLIGNALNHGKYSVSICMERGEEGIRTTFTNGAPELTQDDLAHVFDRFYTGDKPRTGGSTGLGLAIVKALVEQMGHTVWAALEDGRFTVGILWKSDSCAPGP